MPKQNRQVSFQDEIDVIEIPSLCDFTADELSFLYFSPAELEEIHNRDNLLLYDLSIHDSISSDEHDFTGLDNVHTNSTRKWQALIGMETVFTEQELEEIEGNTRDDFYIARVYEDVTLQNKVLAFHRGLNIAMQVKALWFEDLAASQMYREKMPGDRSRHTKTIPIAPLQMPSQSPPQHYRLVGPAG